MLTLLVFRSAGLYFQRYIYMLTHEKKPIGTALPLNNNNQNNERSERVIVKTNECFRKTRFLIITSIGEYKNDSNTQRF